MNFSNSLFNPKKKAVEKLDQKAVEKLDQNTVSWKNQTARV